MQVTAPIMLKITHWPGPTTRKVRYILAKVHSKNVHFLNVCVKKFALICFVIEKLSCV